MQHAATITTCNLLSPNTGLLGKALERHRAVGQRLHRDIRTSSRRAATPSSLRGLGGASFGLLCARRRELHERSICVHGDSKATALSFVPRRNYECVRVVRLRVAADTQRLCVRVRRQIEVALCVRLQRGLKVYLPVVSPRRSRAFLALVHGVATAPAIRQQLHTDRDVARSHCCFPAVVATDLRQHHHDARRLRDAQHEMRVLLRWIGTIRVPARRGGVPLRVCHVAVPFTAVPNLAIQPAPVKHGKATHKVWKRDPKFAIITLQRAG